MLCTHNETSVTQHVVRVIPRADFFFNSGLSQKGHILDELSRVIQEGRDASAKKTILTINLTSNAPRPSVSIRTEGNLLPHFERFFPCTPLRFNIYQKSYGGRTIRNGTVSILNDVGG
jgi:hypothetical protein